MNRILHMTAVAVAVSTMWTAPTFAAVSADEAKQLDGPVLTAFGAERAGNKEGTIPAYTGEPIKVPECYDPKEPGNYCDPWDDKPLFTVSAQNMEQYTDQLTAGQIELMKLYPEYKINVYPSKRTMIYPEYVLDNTRKNATSCKGINNEIELEGCYGGLPFPIPKTGNQVVWNHVLYFSTHKATGNMVSLYVDPNGRAINQGVNDASYERFFYDPANTQPFKSDAPFHGVRLDTTGPARKAGEKLIVLYSLNSTQRAYQYLPGQRRVKLAPDLAYDTPSSVSGGISTTDEQDMFSGPLDRYDFELVGKKEKFIPYNTFDLVDHRECGQDVVIRKNFPNPDCMRFELHRVWHVKATIKPEFRHILPTRDMYFDEDNPYAGWGDNYDAAGKMYRVDYTLNVPFYDQGYGGLGVSNMTIDLQKGAWAYANFTAYPGGGWHPTEEQKPASFWTPRGLAADGIR